MITVNGVDYDVPIDQILEDVRLECPFDIFRHIKDLGNNVMTTCPYHGDGQESNPSFGISTSDTYRNGKLIPAGTGHCFTCKETVSLDVLISDVFNYKDGGRFGNKWLRNHYSGTLIGKKRSFDLHFSRDDDKDSIVYITDDILDTFRYTHPYMYKRGLTDEIIDIFDIGYDDEMRCITMPVHDLQGRVPLIQRRGVGKKFHHYAQGVDKTNYLYGAYELLKYYPDKHTEIWIVESILNCLTCWVYDIPAVALMGVGGGKQIELLRKLPYRNIVLALDPDSPGQTAQWELYHKLKKYKNLGKLIYKNDTDDINDLREKILTLQIQEYQ